MIEREILVLSTKPNNETSPEVGGRLVVWKIANELYGYQRYWWSLRIESADGVIGTEIARDYDGSKKLILLGQQICNQIKNFYSVKPDVPNRIESLEARVSELEKQRKKKKR